MLDTNYEHIERYLNNELPPADMQDFENQLADDSKLREQLRVYKEVNGILSKRMNQPEGEKRLRKQLKKRQATFFKTGSKVIPMTSPRLRWYSVASVAAVALILILWLAPWQQKALSRYGQIEMTAPTVRGNEQTPLMTRAAHLFNDKKYKEALPLLDSLVLNKPQDARSQFFRGVSLLHLHKEAKARKDFQSVFQGQSVYRYDAAYFTALSYLQKEQKDSCRIWLQKIPSDAAVYPKAEKMLKNVGK